MEVKITTLIENNEDNNGVLFYQHGLSLYIEINNKKILFDTGQNGDFIKNADILDKPLNSLEYVVLSHGHYDHAGGFMSLLDVYNKSAKVYIGEEFFYHKYKNIGDNEYKYNGISFDEEDLAMKKVNFNKIKEDFVYLDDKIIIFHNFKSYSDYEKLNGDFFVKKQYKMIRDDFNDEIALALITRKGLVVVAGCAHVGIVNILKTIKEKTNMNIYAVVGGTHLVKADDFRINNTISDIKKIGVEVVAVSHCNGEYAKEKMKEGFGKKFIVNNTGNVIEI